MRNPQYSGGDRNPRRFFALFFRSIGAAILLGGLIYGAIVLVFVRTADRAPGVVTKIDAMQNAAPLLGGSGGSGVFFYPVIQFETGSGSMQEFRAANGSQSGGYQVGDRVAILYSAGNPANARIDTTWGIWGGPLLVLALGVVFLILGALAPMGFGSGASRIRDP